MNNPTQNSVREQRQTFDLSGTAGANLPAVNRPLRVKVFKSGNSLALRLPKALGLAAGMELELTTAADGSYALRSVEPSKRKIDVSGFWGKAPGIRLAPREDFEERPSTIAARAAASKAPGSK